MALWGHVSPSDNAGNNMTTYKLPNSNHSFELAVDEGSASLLTDFKAKPKDVVYNNAIDGLEALLLALAGEGIPISDKILTAVDSAIQAIAANVDEHSGEYRTLVLSSAHLSAEEKDRLVDDAFLPEESLRHFHENCGTGIHIRIHELDGYQTFASRGYSKELLNIISYCLQYGYGGIEFISTGNRLSTFPIFED